MAQSQPKLVDAQDYARLAEESETRLEWIGGQIVAMAGASIPHAKIAGRVARAINNRMENGSCEAVTSDVRVHVEATGENFYPDVVTVCEDSLYYEALPHTLLNPVVVVEVLSPTTQKKDRESKLAAYKRLPSLQHYLLVSQDRVMVHHYERSGQNNWKFSDFYWRSESVALEALDLSIPLEEIYRNLNVPEGLTLIPLPDNSD